MRVINIFGGPGAGKSTIAAGLFYNMKLAGLRVEFITEFAKDLTYEKNSKTLGNQLTVFGEQYNRIYRTKDEVDWLVTDSPLLLSIVYARGIFQAPWFYNCVHEAFLTFDNINYNIKRVKEYQEYGRNETEKEAIAIDDYIESLLEVYRIKYYSIDGNEEAAKTIFNNLMGEYGLK